MSDPIFKPIFGESWDNLPPVMKAHYANRPFCEDAFRVKGTMAVWAAPMLKIFAPITRLLGWIPIAHAKNIPVTVDFKSNPQSSDFHFVRTFHFPGKKSYVFHSRMIPGGGNHMAERMNCGACWRIAFQWEDGKVKLRHRGYGLNVFGTILPLPLNWILGSVHAEEWPLGDNSFGMAVEIHHPLFGKIYEYRGDFELVNKDD